MTITWTQWKQAIVELIRSNYRELFAHVQLDDIDWDAWRPLYEQGCSPAVAVSIALSPTPELMRTERAA